MLKKSVIIILSLIGLELALADDLSLNLQNTNQIQTEVVNNLWQRMRLGFKLNHKSTKEVRYWEKRYGSPRYFKIIMQNMAPYLYFIITELERRGIPTELALIPIVESTYNPNAVSPGGISTGMWQFVASSGRRFGLIVDKNQDQRKSIIDSSLAAIAYLQYLHALFHSWELAIAAYNWGEGNINSAIINSNTRDFYQLDVRDITHQYVPKVIALARIIENPKSYGIKLIDLPNTPYFAINYNFNADSLTKVLQVANLSTAENRVLNPQYNSLSYSLMKTDEILLPIKNTSTYLTAYNLTKPGLINLAAFKAIKPTLLTNNEASPPPVNKAITQESQAKVQDPILLLATGQELSNSPVIQKTQQKLSNSPQVIIQDNKPIALKKSIVSVAETKLSKAKPDLIADLLAEDKLKQPSLPTVRFKSYIVRSGDTLYSIAKKFSISVNSLKLDNQLKSSLVELNQVLKIRLASIN